MRFSTAVYAIFVIVLVSGCESQYISPDQDGGSEVWVTASLVAANQPALQLGATSTCYMGIRAHLRATVRGWGPGGNCRVLLSLDGRTVADSTVTLLSTEGVATASYEAEVEGPEWEPAGPGVYVMSASLDPGIEVADSDSSNNLFESRIQVKPGNIAVQWINVSESLYPGTPLSTVAIGDMPLVSAAGSIAGFCKSYRVQISCGEDTILDEAYSGSVPFYPGSWLYYARWTPQQTGNFIVRVIVDADNQWAEEFETDNTASRTITVVP